MKIGYDGKRAFQNKTGLGNYIRSLMGILTQYYPENEYTLFAPKITDLFDYQSLANVKAIAPQSGLGKKLPALWRSRWMTKDIAASGMDIFHGVSHQLPAGIENTRVKTVVTVHDLIFERYPETYHFDERYVHRWKIKHACKIANSIVAISTQTKEDLINLYKIPAEKIHVCLQSCNLIFQRKVSPEEKAIVKKRYNLPDQYFLFVSSIAPRKNLLSVCKALVLLKEKSSIPLVVIGNGKKEKEEVKNYMAEHGISHQLILLNEHPASKENAFTSAEDFPAIYQQALALVYPSLFEGFGAPLLEALWSGIPVICSNTSCLPEVGGDAAQYFEPYDINAIAHLLLEMTNNQDKRNNMIDKGFQQANRFTATQYANDMMKVYRQIL